MKRKFKKGNKVILTTLLDGDYYPVGTILTIDCFTNRTGNIDYYDVKEDRSIGYSEHQLRKLTKLDKALK